MIDSSRKRICRLNFEFHVVKGHNNILSFNNGIPSFIGNLWRVLLLGNNLKNPYAKPETVNSMTDAISCVISSAVLC